MSGNRIRRYENLWTGRPEAVAAAEQPSVGPAPGSLAVPPGFALFSSAHLSPAHQRAIAARGELYQRAYDEARRAADEQFNRDWVI